VILLLLILGCYSVVPSDTMLRKGHAFVTALIIIIIIIILSVLLIYYNML